MGAPKYDTIDRYCSNGQAIEILHKRGVITDAEAADLYKRANDKTNASYARIYSNP